MGGPVRALWLEFTTPHPAPQIVVPTPERSWFGFDALRPHVGELVPTPQLFADLYLPIRAQDSGVLRPKAIVS